MVFKYIFISEYDNFTCEIDHNFDNVSFTYESRKNFEFTKRNRVENQRIEALQKFELVLLQMLHQMQTFTRLHRRSNPLRPVILP